MSKLHEALVDVISRNSGMDLEDDSTTTVIEVSDESDSLTMAIVKLLTMALDKMDAPESVPSKPEQSFRPSPS